MCLFFTFNFFFVIAQYVSKNTQCAATLYSAFKSHDNNNLKRTRLDETNCHHVIPNYGFGFHPPQQPQPSTPQNFHLSNLFFSHPSIHCSILLSLLSFSVTKLNVTHGGEDSQIYGIKLQITLSSQEILKDVFQMMRRGWW